MRGWIIDAKLNYEKNVLEILAIDENGRRIFLGIQPLLKLYLTIRDASLYKEIVNSDYIESYAIEKWYYPPWYRKSREIIVLSFVNAKLLKSFINRIRGDGRFTIWNEFPDIEARTLFACNLPLFTLIDLERMIPLEDAWDITFTHPPLRRVFIRLLDWYGDVLYPFKFKPKEIYVEFKDEDNSYDVRFRSISEAAESIKDFNPHIIEAENGDVIKYVKNTLNLNDIVYIDYSKTVLSPKEFYGLLELSRISYTGLSKASKSSIGRILTTIEALEAVRYKRLIPDIRADSENYKSPSMLLKIDRGGLIYTPNPGLYWNVAQCDYTSLYPSIIVKYNVGNETVNYRRCNNSYVIPESKHKICLDHPSIVAIALKKIIERRIILKDIARDTKDPIVDARQKALKWISVASFGYLGYRNARFGKIEAYECVTSLARNILLKTINIANKLGFKVIHTLVDSIWITKDGADINDYLNFCRIVSKRLGLRIDLETYYKWFYIPQNRSTLSTGSVNRYYGVDYQGHIKIKGIEAIRRDSPEIIKNFQIESINLLSKAKDPDHFNKLIREVHRLYKQYSSDIKNFRVDQSRLIIRRKVNKMDYRRNLALYKVLRQLNLTPPATIKFIMSIDGPKAVELWRDYDIYDPSYYTKLLDSALMSMPVMLNTYI